MPSLQEDAVLSEEEKKPIEESIAKLEAYGQALMKPYRRDLTLASVGDFNQIDLLVMQPGDLIIARNKNGEFRLYAPDNNRNFNMRVVEISSDKLPFPAKGEEPFLFKSSDKKFTQELAQVLEESIGLETLYRKGEGCSKGQKAVAACAQLRNTLEHSSNNRELENNFQRIIQESSFLNEFRRKSGKHLAANVVFGLTGIGFIMQLGHLLVSEEKRLDINFSKFFSSKISSQKKVDQVLDNVTTLKNKR